MENLAYLHLVLAYESANLSESEISIEQVDETRLLSENGKKYSSVDSLLRTRRLDNKVSSFRLNFLIKIKSIALATILLFSSPAFALLREGSSGKDVVLLQYNLKQLGYYNKTTPSTGYFGKTTNARVRQFQKDNGLVVDGIVGPKTESALNQALQNKKLKVDDTVGTQRNIAVEADLPSGISARAYFYRGLKQRQFEDALSDYSEAIKRDKNFAEPYYRRGMLYAYNTVDGDDFPSMIGGDRNQDIDEALNNFDKAIKLNPDYEKAYLERGIIFNLNKNWESAINDWDKVILNNPNNMEAYYRRASAKEQLKNTKGAINDYIVVIETQLKLEQDQDLKKLVEQLLRDYNDNLYSTEFMLPLFRGIATTHVFDFFQREEYSGSMTGKRMEQSREDEEQYTDDSLVYYNAAFEGLKNLSESIEKNLESSNHTQRQKDLNILTLCRYYQALNKYKLASLQRESLRDVLNLFDAKNTFASSHYYRGIIIVLDSFQKEREEEAKKLLLQEAKKEFDEAIKQDTNFSKAYYLRGIIRSQQGDEKGAISDFNQYVQGDSQMEEAEKMRDFLYGAGRFSLKASFLQEIPKEFLDTLNSASLNDATSYVKRGKLRFLLGDYPGAKRDFQQAITINTDLAEAYYLKGKVDAYKSYNLFSDSLTEVSNAKEAKGNFDLAIQKNPNFSDAYFERGYLQYKIILNISKEERDTEFSKKTDDDWINSIQNDFNQSLKDERYLALANYLILVSEKYKKERLSLEDSSLEKKSDLKEKEINNFIEAIRSDIYFPSNFIVEGGQVIINNAILMNLDNSQLNKRTKPSYSIPFKSKTEEYYYNKALNNYQDKRYKEVIENISKAIEINPNISDYYVIRGISYYFYKDNNYDYYNEALKDLEKSLKLDPFLELNDLVITFFIPPVTYPSFVSHFFIGLINTTSSSQKYYRTSLKLLPQADWNIVGGGDGNSIEQKTSSSAGTSSSCP